MLTLVIARRAGLPWLIQGAVELLAENDRPIAEWCSNQSILRWATTEELSKVAKMKEMLWQSRQRMAAIPGVRHGGQCILNEQVKDHCKSVWSVHWLFKIQKHINGRHSGTTDFSGIRKVIQETAVVGMGGECKSQTVMAVIGSDVWKMEGGTISATVDSLMVDVALMDGPDGVQEIQRVCD
jgi:hypothetical protein